METIGSLRLVRRGAAQARVQLVHGDDHIGDAEGTNLSGQKETREYLSIQVPD